MKIAIGSKNSIKSTALKEIIQEYEFLRDAEVIEVEVSSGVSEQPKSIDEIIRGAINRARIAYQNCDYSVGIEDGINPIPHTTTGYMNFCGCAIYDGEKFYIGLGSGFEYPAKVTRLVVEEGLDIDQAFHRAGLTENPDIGNAEGAISILTRGRLPRKEYTKQAIRMALIHLEDKSFHKI